MGEARGANRQVTHGPRWVCVRCQADVYSSTMLSFMLFLGHMAQVFVSGGSDMPTTHKGECFCGAVHVEVSGEPEAMGYCHCRSCRSCRRLGHDIGFGIGIAHGFATLGTIGFEGRFDYAAIGTVSNVASRLCDEAKPGQILISPRVLMAVEDAVTV